jgi:hypothetical protein
VNEKELSVRVKELAGRVGCPVPALKLIDRTDTGSVQLNEQAGAGPVLEVRSDLGELPASQLEFLIVQELVSVSLGRVRFYRRLQVPIVVLMFLLALGLAAQFPIWQALPCFVGAYLVLRTAVSVVATRIFQRRVDRRIAQALGADRLAAALRELADGRRWRHSVGWLYRGAVPQPPERLKWLRTEA